MKIIKIIISQLILISAISSVQADIANTYPPMDKNRKNPIYITPNIEALYICDESMLNTKSIEETEEYCLNNNIDSSKALNRLLNELEPNGASGQVQIGYTLTIPLLSLYIKNKNNWEIDKRKTRHIINLIKNVDRPVVVYLSATHFDAAGEISEELIKDPQIP